MNQVSQEEIEAGKVLLELCHKHRITVFATTPVNAAIYKILIYLLSKQNPHQEAQTK